MPTWMTRTWQGDRDGPAPRRERQDFDYKAFIPDRIGQESLRLPDDLFGLLVEAEASVRALQVSPDALALGRLGGLLLRAESLASSRIEGLELSPRRLAEAELDEASARETAREVLGNLRAMRAAIAKGSTRRPLHLEDFLEMHRPLLEGGPGEKFAGKLRESQNWIGGSMYSPKGADFIPPPEGLVPELLEDLCRFVNRTDVPAIAQAAISHAQFETIHPFADGNGRTGRALIHVVLLRRGLVSEVMPPVSVAMYARKTDYLQGLTRFEEGDRLSCIRLLAQSVTLAAKVVQDLGSEIGAFTRGIQDQVRPRAGSTAANLIPLLPNCSVLDARSVQSLLSVSDEAARKALQALEDARVLRSAVQGKRRNRVWYVPEIFEILERAQGALR